MQRLFLDQSLVEIQEFLPGISPVSKRNRKVKKTSEKGFTLVELIVTLVIVGILATAALYRYLDLSKVAMSGACRTNQFSLETAQAMHFSETCLKGQGRYAAQMEELTPYLRDGTTPICPGGGQYILQNSGRVVCTITNHQK